MSVKNVDSKSHGAFQLGYLGRRLREAGEMMGYGDTVIETGWIFGVIDAAAFVLLADDPVNYRFFQEKLREISEIYEIQADLVADEETLASAPGLSGRIWRSLREPLGRLEILKKRALKGEGVLEAWFAVGDALADLTCQLRAKAMDDSRSEPDWDPLRTAVEKLPPRDRGLVDGELNFRGAALGLMIPYIEDAHGYLSQHAIESDLGRSTGDVTTPIGPRKLTPGERRAYEAFLVVSHRLGREPLDEEAYKYLRANRGDLEELPDEFRLSPSVGAFRRALGRAREKLGEQKYNTGSGEQLAEQLEDTLHEARPARR